MTIWFDMDGTIADFYGVDNWLTYLLNENPYPYKVAKPIPDLVKITELLVKLQIMGYKIGIISWLSKDSNRAYDSKVRNAKYSWLKENMAITFDTIHIVKYGTSKEKYKIDNDILFDDEERNRKNWGNNSFTPNEIISVLSNLLNGTV